MGRLLVIGAGPGGFDAAVRGAELGLDVTLAERDALGGTCLNRGCIPTKLFLGATTAQAELAAAKKLKVASGDLAFDLPALQKRKTRVLGGTHKAMAKQLADAGIALVTGEARLTGPDTAVVAGEDGDTEIGFDAVILATGSRPAAFPGLEPDGDSVLNSDQLLDLDTVPQSLIVVGGGAIGLEMAEFFHRLGTSIVLVEAADTLVPTEDPEIGDTLAKAHKRAGWDVRTGARVDSLITAQGRARMTLADGETVEADKALVAVGRKPNTEGLGLETAGIAVDGRGWITVDDALVAPSGNAARALAIGDVNGRVLLAHAAAHQAHHAAANAAALINGAEATPYPAPIMPSCVYGHIEVMRAGATAKELASAGGDIAVSTAQLAPNPMAQAHGATQGMVRVIWHDGRVAGIAAVGHGVSHLVTQAVLIVRQGWTHGQANEIVWAHPSLDEALKAALEAKSSPVS